MKSLFFYGTLRHLPLLEIVLGRDASMIDATPAVLGGFKVNAVAEGPFPMIAELSGAKASGLLVKGLSAQDVTRLDYYEGSFAYDLQRVTLSDGQEAEVYVPQAGRWTPDGPWSLEDWAAKSGQMSVIAAAEVMSYLGHQDRDAVAAMFPVIRARADAQVRAAHSLHSAECFHGHVEIENRTRAYSKFYAMDDLVLRHERFDGTMSESLERAVLIDADAALVMPYDPLRDRVLLVEQIRLGPIGRGDRAMWQLEPVAGRIDPGEHPEEAARREALEEAGLTLGGLEKIAEVYPSPGTSTGFYYLYLGLADLPDRSTGIGGLPEENEDIRSHLMSYDDLMARVERFDVAGAPMVMAAYYLARHRDRLRQGIA
ncbi:NUDIX domain-containing protein [Sulfitobacter sp. F26204]|uniref:NUDIX domain-containing protein n=1 Tax=Sulfitobacter sp. F26204 TaxID=2996014 RepID=UPI00225E0399|nr:NUDIX domain-containing protein [Sulfitobacter sp. F26204]MCX7559652.1 NUDIX domain-containing protein [Sulfitobacter sp. F26204]